MSILLLTNQQKGNKNDSAIKIAEDLNCYTELLSGITRKFQQFSYRKLYLYDIQKTIRILKIYQEWLLAQSDQNFSELYDKFLGGDNVKWILQLSLYCLCQTYMIRSRK